MGILPMPSAGRTQNIEWTFAGGRDAEEAGRKSE
jgi:hypothetical protein